MPRVNCNARSFHLWQHGANEPPSNPSSRIPPALRSGEVVHEPLCLTSEQPQNPGMYSNTNGPGSPSQGQLSSSVQQYFYIFSSCLQPTVRFAGLFIDNPQWVLRTLWRALFLDGFCTSVRAAASVHPAHKRNMLCKLQSIRIRRTVFVKGIHVKQKLPPSKASSHPCYVWAFEFRHRHLYWTVLQNMGYPENLSDLQGSLGLHINPTLILCLGFHWGLGINGMLLPCAKPAALQPRSVLLKIGSPFWMVLKGNQTETADLWKNDMAPLQTAAQLFGFFPRPAIRRPRAFRDTKSQGLAPSFGQSRHKNNLSC